jgi:hypothetical protein
MAGFTFDDAMNGLDDVQRLVDTTQTVANTVRDTFNPKAAATLSARERLRAKMREKAKEYAAAARAQREAANAGATPTPIFPEGQPAPSSSSAKWPLIIGAAGLAIQLLKR